MTTYSAVPAPEPRIDRRTTSTIPRMTPSIRTPTKRRQNPARGPDARPVGDGPAVSGGGGYIVTEELLSAQSESCSSNTHVPSRSMTTAAVGIAVPLARPCQRVIARHLDALHERRVVLEKDVVPPRRIRVVEGLRREEPEELHSRLRVTCRPKRRPVRLRLEVAADHVLDRERRRGEDDVDEDRERDRLGPPHAAAPSRRTRDQERDGEGKEGIPADRLPDVVVREMAELVREHAAVEPRRERRLEDRPPGGDV